MIADEDVSCVSLFVLMEVYNDENRSYECEEHLIVECGLRIVGENLQQTVRSLSSRGKQPMLEWGIQEDKGKRTWNIKKRRCNCYE